MRNNWTRAEITDLFELPFLDLVARAHDVHVRFHPENKVQLLTRLSIKNGTWNEDCLHLTQLVADERWVPAKEVIDPLEVVSSGDHTSCGAILQADEARAALVGFIHALATLPERPHRVPLAPLVSVSQTGSDHVRKYLRCGRIDDIEFIRTVAVTRISMPLSMVHVSAGREDMSDSTQSLCFMAGANSIFIDDRFPTLADASDFADEKLFAKLGLKPMQDEEALRIDADLIMGIA